MKLYATIENEAGKIASKAGNEYLDIDIFAGNRKIASLTVRDEKVSYRGKDWDIRGIEYKAK